MLSQRQQLFLLHFADPHLGGGDLGLSIDLFAREQEWPGFRREGEGGALTLWRPIGRHTSAFLSYRVEAVSIAPDDSVAVALARAVTPEASLSTADLFLSSLRAGVEHSTVDGSFLPRRGSSAGAWIEAADHRLGSDADLVRGRVWGAHHRPLGPFTLHLAARAEGVSSRDPLGVPLSERLQLDGSSDVRGLAPGALGRVDPATGMALGGDLLMTGRAEIEVPIWPGAGLSGLVFADAGAVLDTQEGSGGLGASTGVGLLWRSPIGPLRFDWAVPLDGDRSAPRFLFSLGGAL
ncbi:MAG TPA: outer membrane protein assembly factor [Kofleriaceae bacterium]|nr:outer membrane protein assembly factor [Kofleriaceae bacterium]